VKEDNWQFIAVLIFACIIWIAKFFQLIFGREKFGGKFGYTSTT